MTNTHALKIRFIYDKQQRVNVINKVIIVCAVLFVSHFHKRFCRFKSFLFFDVEAIFLFKTMEIRFCSCLAVLHLFFFFFFFFPSPWKAFVNDQPAVLNTASGHISFLKGYSSCVKCVNEQLCVPTCAFLSPCLFFPLPCFLCCIKLQKTEDKAAARPLYCDVVRLVFIIYRRYSV